MVTPPYRAAAVLGRGLGAPHPAPAAECPVQGVSRPLRPDGGGTSIDEAVDADEIVSLVIGTCHAVERMRGSADSVQRLIGVLCEGRWRGANEG
jgi:hypothetical protein